MVDMVEGSPLAELLAQREQLDAQIAAIREKERQTAIQTVRALVIQFDLSSADCGFKPLSADRQKTQKVNQGTVKYRGPNGQEWTGRGRAPNWIIEMEKSGRKRTDFLIG